MLVTIKVIITVGEGSQDNQQTEMKFEKNNGNLGMQLALSVKITALLSIELLVDIWTGAS